MTSLERMTVSRALACARFAVDVGLSASGRWYVLGPVDDKWPRGAKHEIIAPNNADARTYAARWKAQIALCLMGWSRHEANVATAEAQAAGISGYLNLFHHARRNRAD